MNSKSALFVKKTFAKLISHIQDVHEHKRYVCSISGKKFASTVKLGDKERFDKEQIGVKELFTD